MRLTCYCWRGATLQKRVHDPNAVAGSDTVGHVPRSISSVCSRHGGVITCTATGSRQYTSVQENKTCHN